ncbi:hypothetical protein AMATHDRAFT_5283 [Amanita thiersii Skay4041]|uniref:Uncharacterized protein n=1 Tax=Amanita thiersii Skay4041 TaxID=703135 RepID=A0A2A9NL31_9AGAR|nr:hypothetical protein AMATHDRAFT_5283 [Amanita thiersii Skay4041]
MGGGAIKMSDLFYPDNPNRRARASRLKEDVEFFCNQFDEAKKKHDDLLTEIKPQVNTLMKKYGYNTIDELEKGIQSILKGKALKEYNKVKKQMEGADEAIAAVFQITSVIGAATGIFLGVVVVLGIMSGGAAPAALGIIGASLGAVALAAILFSVFEGAEECANMQNAIRDLSLARVKARSCYEAMNALANWLYNIKLWLDEPLISDNESLMKKKLEGNFATDYNKSKSTAVVLFLEKYDRDRGAWTNEDPDWKDSAEDIIASMSAASKTSETEKVDMEESTPEAPTASHITFDYSSPDGSGTLQLEFVTSDETSCTGQDQDGNTWVIRYKSEQSSDLSDPDISHYFSLDDVDAGYIYNDCRLHFRSRPFA